MPSSIPVIIHFVGLALFSSQVPNDCGVKVILPQVIYTGPGTAIAKVGTLAKVAAVPARPFGPVPHVEDHVALLVFPAANYATSINWSTPLALDSTYLYVKLDGERIRFDGGSVPNPAANINNLHVPSLQALCPSMHSLNANFEPPYTGAAAVFDLPLGNVNACDVANKRIDTEIGLQSSGLLTISASTMRVRKEIRLKPDSSGVIRLIVANVPVSCLTKGSCTAPNTSDIDSVTHVHAYYAMGDCKVADSQTESITTWAAVNISQVTSTAPCSMTIPSAVGGLGMAGMAKPSKVNPTPNTLGADFECSNSSWP